jgi:hypothetical protein
VRYRIRVAGKIFEGNDPKVLLKRAVEAKRSALGRKVKSGTMLRKAINETVPRTA